MDRYIDITYNNTWKGKACYMILHFDEICSENIPLRQFKKIIKFVDNHYDNWHQAHILIMYWLEYNHKVCVEERCLKAAASIERKINWMKEAY